MKNIIKIVKSKTFKIILSAILTIIFTYLIISYIDFKYFFEQIKNINYIFLIFAALSLTVNYYFRGLRLKLILGVNNSLKLSAISTIHYLFNRIIPARLGEASLPILFKKHLNIDYKKGISSLLFYRIFDFLLMLFLLLISLSLVRIENINLSGVILFSISGIILLALSWFYLSKIINLLLKILHKIKIQVKIIKKIETFLIKIKNYKETKDTKFMLKIFVYTLINWLIIYLYYYFILLAFTFDIGYFETIFVASVSNFSFIIPNAVGNIGPFEAGWGLGFYLLGISKNISVPMGLFANIFATIITAVLALISFIFLNNKFTPRSLQ